MRINDIEMVSIVGNIPERQSDNIVVSLRIIKGDGEIITFESEEFKMPEQPMTLKNILSKISEDVLNTDVNSMHIIWTNQYLVKNKDGSYAINCPLK